MTAGGHHEVGRNRLALVIQDVEETHRQTLSDWREELQRLIDRHDACPARTVNRHLCRLMATAIQNTNEAITEACHTAEAKLVEAAAATIRHYFTHSGDARITAIRFPAIAAARQFLRGSSLPETLHGLVSQGRDTVRLITAILDGGEVWTFTKRGGMRMKTPFQLAAKARFAPESNLSPKNGQSAVWPHFCPRGSLAEFFRGSICVLESSPALKKPRGALRPVYFTASILTVRMNAARRNPGATVNNPGLPATVPRRAPSPFPQLSSASNPQGAQRSQSLWMDRVLPARGLPIQEFDGLPCGQSATSAREGKP